SPLAEQKATMSTKRPTVLILASDPAFARDISAAWPQEPAPRSAAHSGRPEFVVLDQGLLRDLEGGHYDLAIADASFGKRNIHGKDSQALRQSLVATRKPAIIIHSGRSLDFYELHGAVLELRREPGVWPAIVGLAGREILRRIQAESRAREARALSAAAQAEATLGRYIIEMRTNINNALTTVLGNAELIMLAPGLPPSVLAEADTIRNMALRLHEVFQRFSSLEKELRIEEELSGAARESARKAAHAAGNC
ncbi:MAG: hypothetical protein WCB94_13485, partial [Terriglobales bacterium]